MTSQQDEAESEIGELPTFDLEASPASSMAKQIDAFSHLAEESRQTYNIDSLRAALEYLVECPFIGTPRRVTPGKLTGGATTRKATDTAAVDSNGQLTVRGSLDTDFEIESVSSLSQMRALLNKWRKKCGKTRSETDYVNRLERFFKEFQYQRRLARYFVQRIYAPLYKKFFDINILTAVIDEPIESAEPPQGDDEESSGFFLTECAIPEETSVSKDDDKISTIPERFEGVVQKLTVLHAKWRTLLKEDTVFSENSFETSSSSSVESVAKEVNNPSLLLALRLVPDLVDKCSLAAALALEWLGISENLSPTGNEVVGKVEVQQTEEMLKALRKEILKKESDIRRGEHSLNIYETELKQLSEREERVLGICSNCEELEKHREKVGEEYQEKVESRVKLVEELDNTIQGSQRFRDLSVRLKALENDINNQYGELKLVEYALNIAANDYDLHMNVQPSFYAYSRTARDKMERTQRELARHREEKDRLDRKYERVTEQMEQMRLVVEEAAPRETDKTSNGRPATNETYTRFRIDDRYSDKGQLSDNSLTSGTDGEVEQSQEVDKEAANPGNKTTRQSDAEISRPRARATEFPVWPIHSGPGTLVNHSAPLG